MLKFIRHIKDMIALVQLPKEQRRIVFYSEGKSYWVHLEGILKQFLEQTDTYVCYVSSSADDPGLEIKHPYLQSFIIDQGVVRNWFFENLDTDIMVMTMPDLHQYQVKRSKHPVHYVYVQHSLVSLHMIYRKGAFDHYDTIFCSGPHHIKEIRAMEKRYKLPEKNIFKHGYGRLDSIIASAASHKSLKKTNIVPRVLIAPSWGKNALIETVGNEVVNNLLEAGFHVTLRPHPQTAKLSKKILDNINRTYKNNNNFELEMDISSQESLHHSDLMISDWSGAALDYAFGLERPVLFVDVPRKVNNKEYQELDIEPFEVSIRNKIGEIIVMNELDKINEKVHKIIGSIEQYKARIIAMKQKHIFYTSLSDKVGADFLLHKLSK